MTEPSRAIELTGVSVTLGDCTVLEEITWGVDPGRFVAIIGPNGAGKTTCLKVILGLIPPSQGTVRLFGMPPTQAARKATMIGYVPQRSIHDRSLPFSVLDVVLMGRVGACGPLRWFSRHDRELAMESLRRVDLAELKDHPIGELSGGQLQRALIARALACGSPRLLVLDEPTIGVDIPHQVSLYEILTSLRRDLGLTILVVSHDLAMISHYADEMVCLNRTMHVHGNPHEVLHSRGMEEAYRCEFERLFGQGRPI
jgi:zinc transport system ATP-binding protein